MGRRWTEEDIAHLRDMARRHSAPTIAEKIDRSVGAVAFKAHQLKLSLRPRAREGQALDSAKRKSAGLIRNT